MLIIFTVILQPVLGTEDGITLTLEGHDLDEEEVQPLLRNTAAWHLQEAGANRKESRTWQSPRITGMHITQPVPLFGYIKWVS